MQQILCLLRTYDAAKWQHHKGMGSQHVHLDGSCSWRPGFFPCRSRLLPLNLCQKVLAPPDEVVVGKLPQIGI